MKFIKKAILLGVVGFAALTQTSNAQVLDPSDDGIIPEPSKHFHNTRVIPYPFLRQDDMLWSTRQNLTKNQAKSTIKTIIKIVFDLSVILSSK